MIKSNWRIRFTSPMLRPHLRLQPHPGFLAIGADTAARAAGYRALLDAALSTDDFVTTRSTLQQQHALGSSPIHTMPQARIQRFASVRLAHRPRRTTRSGEK